MIDQQQQLYPSCIVWTLLPCISWFFPCIGHVGICNSQGVIHDFMGYRINTGKLSFGSPIKYVKLNDISANDLDKALEAANNRFKDQAHDLCCNNCHNHVACVLNGCEYLGRADWSQLSIWWLCLAEGTYVSKWYLIKVYLPCVLILGIILMIVLLIVL